MLRWTPHLSDQINGWLTRENTKTLLRVTSLSSVGETDTCLAIIIRGLGAMTKSSKIAHTQARDNSAISLAFQAIPASPSTLAHRPIDSPSPIPQQYHTSRHLAPHPPQLPFAAHRYPFPHHLSPPNPQKRSIGPEDPRLDLPRLPQRRQAHKMMILQAFINDTLGRERHPGQRKRLHGPHVRGIDVDFHGAGREAGRVFLVVVEDFGEGLRGVCVREAAAPGLRARLGGQAGCEGDGSVEGVAVWSQGEEAGGGVADHRDGGCGGGEEEGG